MPFSAISFGDGVVDQIAVLDGAHAEPRGAGDRLGRIGVGADVAAEGGGLLHRGADFAIGELQAVERIVGRGDAAGHHDLHMVGALAHLLARGLADFVGAVGDRGFELQAVAADAFAAAELVRRRESEWPPVGPIDWPAI